MVETHFGFKDTVDKKWKILTSVPSVNVEFPFEYDRCNAEQRSKPLTVSITAIDYVDDTFDVAILSTNQDVPTVEFSEEFDIVSGDRMVVIG